MQVYVANAFTGAHVTGAYSSKAKAQAALQALYDQVADLQGKQPQPLQWQDTEGAFTNAYPLPGMEGIYVEEITMDEELEIV